MLEKHKRIIYKVVNAYCRDEVDRQDLIQEIIIQLWVSFEKYDDRYKPSTWIYRIALNNAISFYRKNRIHKEHTISLSTIMTKEATQSEGTHENNDVELLNSAIQELPEIDKALMLLYLDEISYKEISKIMGISTTNISTKIGRIKKKIKQKIEQKYSQRYAGS